MPRAVPRLVLSGWYVISLRPSGQHGGVRRAAAARGARVRALSTLRLEALDAGADLRAALAAPRVLVTSPAAVRFAAAQARLDGRGRRAWFALGAGSARALRRAGVADVQLPAAGSDSEALLALPGLQSLRGADVGLLTAPGGRGLLADTLARRGARVRRADVYRRRVRAPAPARLRALAALPARTALLLTSAEAFEPLWQALDAAGRRRLLARPVVVASARLAADARRRGFKTVLRATDARPAALLDALARHVAAGAFR
jgi:uroporphyrinogen-III synthase